MKRIVVKIGGSLLHQNDWADRFVHWSQTLEPVEVYLIVGGGGMIEAMRELDRLHHLNEVDMHWRCVAMLRHTADIAYEILNRTKVRDRLRLIRDREEFDAQCEDTSRQSDVMIVYPEACYHSALAELNVITESIPQAGWKTTTDAIAVFAAIRLKADACYLLKSCEVEGLDDSVVASDCGVVDSECSRLARVYANVRLVQLPEV
jgi:5-(aminomethyl)-3-furanmethanol phosphate kinase